MSHSVFHGFLHKVEALPPGVKLVFMRAFEMQQVTDDLQDITDKVNELFWAMRQGR